MYRFVNKPCLNCGKKGHRTRSCHYPINSYGYIVWKMSHDQQIRYLMIQRKYTPEYIEIIRGRYYGVSGQLDYQYLNVLIINLPLTERHYIMTYDFDYLWRNIWQWIGTEDQMKTINHDYLVCQARYNQLKQGYLHDQYGKLSFQTLFDQHPPCFTEPHWEFPKGRRREGENDQQCALRECCEETSLTPPDLEVYLHVKPFHEKFTGVNNIKYCNSYYLAQLKTPHRLVYYDPTHTEQNKEIRKISWLTEQEIYPLLSPQQNYRYRLVQEVHTLVSRLGVGERSPHIAPSSSKFG